MREKGFSGSSAGKESACNAGDPSLIPGLGRPPGEGIGYPLQYSWSSLVAPMVKNPPAMRETWVRSLGLGRSPGEGKSYPLQCPGLENSMDYRLPWISARRSNQSVLKEISPECSLEGLMLKLKLQYFGHLMQRTDSLEKTDAGKD